MYISGSKFRREEGFERSQKCVSLLTDSQTEIPNKTHLLTLCWREKSQKQCCQFAVFSAMAVSRFAFNVNFATVCLFHGHLVIQINFLQIVSALILVFLLPLCDFKSFFSAPWYLNGTTVTVNSRRVGCSRLVGRCSWSWWVVLVLD